MAQFTDSAQSKQIDQREHNNDASAKRVVVRYLNTDDGEWYNWDPTATTTSSTVIDPRTGYGISDIEETATYKYFGFEDASGNWYILRKTLATNEFLYSKGASAYSTAWTNRASQTYDTFDNTFDPVTGSVITSTTDISSTIQAADSPSIDAFGRWRVSQPQTLFDSKQLYDNQPLFWDDAETAGSGTSSTHSANTASTTIGVSATTTGTRVRQTFQSFNYQPGKSQQVLMTFVLDKTGGGAGITRRVGQFNANNGIFLEDSAGTYKFVIRTYTGGSASDANSATQSNWNLDKLDGTGTSGINIDFTKAQILIFDYEWLGVGRVRVGFVIDGKIYYAHEFLNANSYSSVYMSTPNLPLRYEISNDGTGAASTLETICTTVISEGGSQELGILRHKDSGSISSLSTGTTYAVLGIRLKSGYIGADISLQNISMISTTTNDQLHWELKLNPTVAGTFTYADETNSAIQTATGAATNTVTGGTNIDGGYLSTALPVTISVPNARKLGASIAGTVDTIVLCARPITNNITIQASMTWREIS